MSTLLLTKKDDFVPLYHKLKNIIRKKIEDGELSPEDQIPSTSELIKRYGVSRITVNKAVSELMHEGWLLGKQGKGVFVKSAFPAFSSDDVVGVVMATTGHLYEQFARYIVTGLTEHHWFPMSIDLGSDSKAGYHKMERLIAKQPAFLVVDNSSAGAVFLAHLLPDYKGHLVFIHLYESGEEYAPASYVLSDLVRGARLATEHLISGGYRRIVFYSFVPPVKNYSIPLVEEGIKMTMKEHGLSEENYSYWMHEPKEALEQRLKKETMPVGVIANMDSLLDTWYSVAENLGLKIPGDIGLVGWNNTPWCDIFRPRLTSLAVREDLIAKEVIDIISDSTRWGSRIRVSPELVIRESTREVKP